MADATTTVEELKAIQRRFVAERDWEPYHSPKNLAMALMVEAAELLEHFLWVEGRESHALACEPARRQEISDELADVTGCLLNLCNELGIDLSDAIRTKMAKNALKYPPKRQEGS